MYSDYVRVEMQRLKDLCVKYQSMQPRLLNIVSKSAEDLKMKKQLSFEKL